MIAIVVIYSIKCNSSINTAMDGAWLGPQNAPRPALVAYKNI